MKTDLTIWKNLNNNITFVNISCYLKQSMPQSKFCKGLDKRKLALKIHRAFVLKYHLAYKSHHKCTKLRSHSYSKQKHCHKRSDCLKQIMISPAICKLIMTVHSITKTSNGQCESGLIILSNVCHEG